MAKKIALVRYFGENNASSTTTASLLCNGRAFKYPIVQLGVLALPGTRIQINNSETPLIIGATGIYELDIDGLAKITSLVFAQSAVTGILDNGTSIIVDYAYDEDA